MYQLSCYSVEKVCSSITEYLLVCLFLIKNLPYESFRTNQKFYSLGLDDEHLVSQLFPIFSYYNQRINQLPILLQISALPTFSKEEINLFSFISNQQKNLCSDEKPDLFSLFRYIICMGQQETKQHSLINNKNWRLLEQQSQIFHYINPYCNRALYNSFTNEYVQEYQLQFTSQQEFISYSKELELRKEPAPYELQAEDNSEHIFRYSPYIYKVKYFLNTSSQDICSSIYKGLLYIQKVDLRLKEINDIPFADQLYLIQATLNGFKALYEKVGYFDISEEMIFISSRGKVRVWMNPNLAKNHPYYVPRTYQSSQLHGSQSQMIVNLINIIQENTDMQNNTKIHFKQYLMNKGIFDRLSFYKALDEFQMYCAENRLAVSDYMRSIFQLYHEDGHNFSESRAERSEVVRLQTNRQNNFFSGNADIHSNPKTHRNHSPDFTSFKKSRLSSNSHASYKSMGQRQSKNEFKTNEDPVFKQQKYSFVPLPTKQKGYSPNNSNKQISFAAINPNSTLHQSPENLFHNEELFGDMPNLAYPHLSRRSNFRNIRKNNEEQSKVPLPSNPVVTFNYSKASSQPVADKINMPNNQRTVNTMNSMSSFSVKETELFFDSKSREYPNSKISYNTYSLDNEIVEDLKKFLGFDVNKF